GRRGRVRHGPGRPIRQRRRRRRGAAGDVRAAGVLTRYSVGRADIPSKAPAAIEPEVRRVHRPGEGAQVKPQRDTPTLDYASPAPDPAKPPTPGPGSERLAC